MEFPRDSEMVYGADMCNRRLRGVKVNPIYQEKDAAGSSDVDPSTVPVGEIQIDMYESLPRKRRILKYSPDAILLSSTNKDGHSIIEWKYPACGCGSSSSRSSNALQNNSPQKCAHSNTCVPAPDCVCGKNINAENPSSARTKTQSHLWGNGGGGSSSSSSVSKDMIRNNLNESSREIPVNDNDIMSSGSVGGSGGGGGIHKDDNSMRDDTSIRECSPIQEHEEYNSSTSGSFEFHQSIPETEKAILSSNKDGINLPPSSADAIVAYATVEHSNPKNIYSVNDFSGELSDTEFSLKHSNKFLNDLDYITSHAIPVCPIDVLNNNHGTVPDQMVNILLHNNSKQSDDIASIKALQQSLSSSNSFDQHNLYNKNGEKTDKNGNGLISTTNATSGGCNCHGRPSLKCPCGRLALQKLLKQKHLFTKGNNVSNGDSVNRDTAKEFDENSNSKQKDIEDQTNDDATKNTEESVLQELNDSFEKELNDSWTENNDDDVENHIIDVDFGEDTNTSKSILISQRRGSKIQECRAIKFAKGTVFYESKRTKYAKERRRPGDIVSDNINLDDLSNGEHGYDNPVFVCDEDIPDSVFYDETCFTTNDEDNSGKDLKNNKNKKKSKNNSRITVTELQDGSIILKPEDLNLPAYLDQYIRSFNNNNLCDDFGKKAPPVSIEALGGMTVADLADIEVAKDDCDYKRRRRKNNAYGYYDEGSAFLRKEQRIKNIKVCVIIFVIFAVICTAIGLGIHYGGGANSTALASAGAGALPGGASSDQKALLERAKAAQNVGGFAGPFL